MGSDFLEIFEELLDVSDVLSDISSLKIFPMKNFIYAYGINGWSPI